MFCVRTGEPTQTQDLLLFTLELHLQCAGSPSPILTQTVSSYQAWLSQRPRPSPIEGNRQTSNRELEEPQEPQLSVTTDDPLGDKVQVQRVERRLPGLTPGNYREKRAAGPSLRLTQRLLCEGEAVDEPEELPPPCAQEN